MIKVIVCKIDRIYYGHWPSTRTHECMLKKHKLLLYATLLILYFNLTSNRCHDQIKKKNCTIRIRLSIIIIQVILLCVGILPHGSLLTMQYYTVMYVLLQYYNIFNILYKIGGKNLLLPIEFHTIVTIIIIIIIFASRERF